MYNNGQNKRNAPPFVRGFFFLIVAAGFILILGVIVMWLWNAILPEALNANPITYWQAMGLLVLSRILFGSFWFGKRGHQNFKKKRAYWREKWMNMDDEERAAFKAKWKDKCRTRNKFNDEASE
ncbi:MAG: hypothetical protein AAF502_12260 [Bacteroidota bacterium]